MFNLRIVFRETFTSEGRCDLFSTLFNRTNFPLCNTGDFLSCFLNMDRGAGKLEELESSYNL